MKAKPRLTLVITLIPAIAFAEEYKKTNEEHHEIKQESRSENIPGLGQSDAQQIRKSTRKGELTAAERSDLSSERARLDDQYSATKSDGTVTKEERADLRGEVMDYRSEVKSEQRDEQRVETTR